MTLTPPLAAFHRSELPRIKRWYWVLLVSVLLHFVAIHWAGIQLVTPDLRNFNVVHASIHHAAAPGSAAALLDNASAAAPMIAAAQPSKVPAATTISNSMSAALPIEQKPPAPNVIEQSAHTAQALSAPSQRGTAPRDNINLPPSAKLQYETSVIKKGLPYQGQTAIEWQSKSGEYKITGETDIADVGIRTFQSEGTIDQSGIVPLLYTEKSNRKSATNTHFQRERNLISFSSSTISYPRQGGEQDRASIIWQLAGIGRGSPEKLMPGADLDMFVAGVRDGTTWHIHVIGEEEMILSTGKINAWHLAHMPPAGSYEQRVDVWLAPRQAWYPVKLRYTQANGDTLDMSLTNISSVPAH